MEESTTFTRKEQVEGLVAVSVDVEMSYAPSVDSFRKSIATMLSTFDEFGWKVTCFVQGEIGEFYPEILSDLSGAGHEVGCHGYAHQDQTKLAMDELERDLQRCLSWFEQAGVKCAGFRSPFFLRHTDLDEILLKHDVPYDSSIPRIWFPGRYDHRKVPSAPFKRPSGLMAAPVGRSRFWLPLSVEHFKVLRPFFRQVPKSINPVVYTHSYSFGDDFRSPWYNCRKNLLRTKEALRFFTRNRQVRTIGELIELENRR